MTSNCSSFFPLFIYFLGGVTNGGVCSIEFVCLSI